MLKLFTLAAKNLIASSLYKFNRTIKMPAKPLFINFPVTYRCNAKCIMCDIWKKYKKDDNENKRFSDELSVEDIAGFLKRNRDFFSDLRSIGFTGGEAFLRKDIVEIIKAVHKELPWVDIGVQTNGLLPELIRDKIIEILKFYPDFKIAVSLDGVGEVHDEIRGIRGAYKKAVRTIEYAKELGIKGITCGMTLTSKNFDKIKEVSRKVESLGCEFSCFLPESSEYFGNLNNKNQLTKKELDIIAEELKDFSYHYFMDNLRLQITGKSSRTLPCYSGYTSYVIDPYGEILPCILIEESFGNIKDGLFKDIINSEKAWGLRKKLEKCECWCQCEVSSSAVAAPLDVFRWFIASRNKKTILNILNKKTLLNRL